MQEKKASIETITRENLTPEFSRAGMVYCSRLAPVEFWSENAGSKIPTFCCLEFGHKGDHRWTIKWKGLEAKDYDESGHPRD